MDVGGLTETVQVSSASPVIDTSSTTIGANIDSDLLSRLPVGRRFSDTLYVAPGVSTGGTVGEANPSISGGSGLENQYVVDGVNITNQGYGALGSYSIVFGSLGNGTPFDFMKEVQVKTGGYEAEYGQATGGVVNVVTKSGTNTSARHGVRLHSPDRAGVRLHAGDHAERHGEHHRERAVRRRHRGRRTDPQEQAVLLRRRRSAVGEADVHRAGRLPARESRRSRSQAADHVLRRQGHVAGDAEPSLRRVVLRRSGARRSGSTADDGAAADDDVGVQRAREVRRPQPVRALRRHHRVALARRGVVRARPQRDRGDPVGGRVERDRHDGHAQHHLRRHRLLRAGQPQRELPVSGQGDQPVRQSPTEVRRARRRRRLRSDQQPHRPDVHARQRRADRDRRHDSDPCRSHVRADLPCDPRQPEHRTVDRPALHELLRAGHVAGQFPPDDSAGHPLRAAGSQGHARRLVQVEQQLGAATRRDVGSDRLEPVEGVRQLRHVLLPRAERSRGPRAVLRRRHRRRLLRRQPDAADS